MKKDKTAKKSNVSGYTATEVGAMLESIDHRILLIAEGHTNLDRRMERLEIEVHGNSNRLDILEIATRVVNDKVSHLENAVSKLNKDVAGLDQKVSSLDQKVSSLDQKVSILDQKVSSLDKSLKETREDLKKEIHELGGRLSAVESR